MERTKTRAKRAQKCLSLLGEGAVCAALLARPEALEEALRKRWVRHLVDPLQAQMVSEDELRTEAERQAAAVVRAVFAHERRQQRLLEQQGKDLRAEDLDAWKEASVKERVRVQSEFVLSEASNVPKAIWPVFEKWKTLTSRIVHVSESADYVTSKLLIELFDGNQIESVIMRHNKRTTICVSSQVGCKMGCTFCATGTLGFRANLTAAEILEQVIHANRYLKSSMEPRVISNLVFMGEGEPLNNYAAVIEACKALTEPNKFSLSPSKITISTVGVVNRMKALAKDVPGISLALSLHAPNQELRQRIIPTAGAYPVPQLVEALEEHLNARSAGSRKRNKRDSYGAGFVMIEYILLSGVNDTESLAHELAVLLQPIKNHVKCNLIPYNPIFNPEGLAKTFEPPTEHDVQRFREILQYEHGIFTTVRTEMGQDVNGACGQLACVSEEAKSREVDIEDILRSRQQNNLYDFQTGFNVKKKTKPLRKQERSSRLQKPFSVPAISAASAVFLAVAFIAIVPVIQKLR